MSTPVTLIPGTVAACYATEQARANAIIGNATAFINGTLNSYVIDINVPGVADHGKLWFNLNDFRLYYWNGASWITPYYFDPYSSLTGSIWLPGKDPTFLLTVDHDGSAVVPGSEATTGPFWKEDTLMQAKFPLGGGTLQPSATSIGYNVTGGLDQITLTDAQGGSATHTHGFGWNFSHANDDIDFLYQGPDIAVPSTQVKFLPGSNNVEVLGATTIVNMFTTPPIIAGVIAPTTLTPVNIMNPYQSGIWAARTARKFFSVI